MKNLVHHLLLLRASVGAQLRLIEQREFIGVRILKFGLGGPLQASPL